MKICTTCREEKELTQYHKAKNGKFGRASKCKVCKSVQCKVYSKIYKQDGRAKAARDRYRNTKRGFLVEKYAEMKRRVEGRGNLRCRKYYEGLDICTKEEFLAWALTRGGFHVLWDNFRAGGRNLSLAVSIDRIDSDKGYVIGNMQFIIHADNARKACEVRWGGPK